jgi:hypothetical protein
MEACGGSHFLGRALKEQGHEVRLMPAQYVKPYVKTNKSDYIDAEAIAEAVGRPKMRFVPIKTDEQLDLQALHRVREHWVMRRTAVINQIRGLLLDREITLRWHRAESLSWGAVVEGLPTIRPEPMPEGPSNNYEAIAGDAGKKTSEVVKRDELCPAPRHASSMIYRLSSDLGSRRRSASLVVANPGSITTAWIVFPDRETINCA